MHVEALEDSHCGPLDLLNVLYLYPNTYIQGYYTAFYIYFYVLADVGCGLVASVTSKSNPEASYDLEPAGLISYRTVNCFLSRDPRRAK